MQRLKFTEAQNKQAVRTHRRCWKIDQKKLKQKKERVEIVKGEMIYRA